MKNKIDVLNLEWTTYPSRDRQAATLVCNYLQYMGFTVIEDSLFRGCYLIDKYNPKMHEKVWDIGFWGVKSMLDELKAKTGLPCNPRTFRRTFACLLRKAGVDTMTIKDLGRWESLEMVQRYTRSVTFQDSLRFYKAPLS